MKGWRFDWRASSYIVRLCEEESGMSAVSSSLAREGDKDGSDIL